MDLTTFIEPKLDLPRLDEILTGLGHEARVHCIRGWSKRLQRTLYEGAAGHRKLSLAMLAPTSRVGIEVICDGQNTVPVFSHFQKRLVRTEGSETLVGYNHNSPFQMALHGPGYFLAKASPDESEVVFDYNVDAITPPLPAWPKFLSNKAPRSLLVFGGLIDYVRAISEHVYIGHATRNGSPMNQYFALVRRD